MAPEFSVDDRAIARLEDTFTRNADLLSDFVPTFRAGAIDGMQTAWGAMGEQTRADYLEGAEAFASAVAGLVEGLREVAKVLHRQQQQVRATEQANADAFGSIMHRLEG